MTVINSSLGVNMNSINTFDSFIKFANSSANDLLFTMIDFMVFFVLFISLTGVFGWEVALLSSGFIGLVLSILLLYAGLTNIWSVSIFVGILIIMFFYIIWSNKYD